MKTPDLPTESKRLPRRAIVGASAVGVGLWLSQAPRYLADFTWTSERLMGALAVPLLLGLGLSRLRYR